MKHSSVKAKNHRRPKRQVKRLVGQRCEGMRRYGGAFSLGPVTWTQCENDATVLLRLKQKDGPVEEMPACMDCWKEAQDPQWNIKILSAKPISNAG